jgi:MraZ protein
MAGFKGHAEYSVDAKGRVALPAKMRRAIRPEANNTVMITRGIENCIFIYPMDEWERKDSEMDKLNQYHGEARDFVRMISMWADDQELDSQGRITLSKKILEFAHITDKVTVVGAKDRIEIWNPDTLEAYMNPVYDRYETLAERVMGGI